jgi:hypothetical protein
MNYQQLAEAEFAESQAEHDRTGVHVWLELTTLDDNERSFLCQHCSAIKAEPFEIVDVEAIESIWKV